MDKIYHSTDLSMRRISEMEYRALGRNLNYVVDIPQQNDMGYKKSEDLQTHSDCWLLASYSWLLAPEFEVNS
jgi:hypothetical protein